MKLEKSHIIIGIAAIALIFSAYYMTQPLTVGTDNISIDVPASNNLEVDAVGDYTTVIFKMGAPQGAGGYIIRMYNPYIAPDGNERKRTVIVEAGESLPVRVQFDNIHVEKLDEWYVDLMDDKYTILNQFSFDFTLSGPEPTPEPTEEPTVEPTEEPTETPTPDPCAGITCNDYCVGTALYYNGYCDNGQCQYQKELNSAQCGYTTPTPSPTPTPTETVTPTPTATPTDDEDGMGGILWWLGGIIVVMGILWVALNAKR